jgi:hypothetical protein
VPDFETVRGLYESDPRLRVRETIQSYVNGQMEEVPIAA